MDDLGEFEDMRLNFIKGNEITSKQKMMDLMYVAITEEKMGALQHDAPVTEKINGVQTILNFFKENEEYEKCAELKKIINELNAKNKS